MLRSGSFSESTSIPSPQHLIVANQGTGRLEGDFLEVGILASGVAILVNSELEPPQALNPNPESLYPNQLMTRGRRKKFPAALGLRSLSLRPQLLQGGVPSEFRVQGGV